MQVTVILEHMFAPTEFEEDPTLREELEDDITAECGKMGKVDKVAILLMCDPLTAQCRRGKQSDYNRLLMMRQNACLLPA